MTSRKDDDQTPRLLTLDDQRKWEAKWAPVLDEAEKVRNRAFDDDEAARFAYATDAILVALRQLRKLGHSRDEAGAELVYEGNYVRARRPWTPTDLLKILNALEINWRVGVRQRPAFVQPHRSCRKGGAE